MSAAPVPDWFVIKDRAEIFSPALIVYRSRVEENIRRMIGIAGAERLRPHIKTHKMREVLALQLAQGITRFKCSTIAEAELAADSGAEEVLLAYQPVGPAVHRLKRLVQEFPRVRISVIADDPKVVAELSRAMHLTSTPSPAPRLEVLVDLDVGQHRTGVPPGPEAIGLYQLITSLPGLTPGGLHAYDGHVSDADPAERTTACTQAFAPVETLRKELLHLGMQVPRVVAGGTPTLPFHAKRKDVECSPGTCVFWDAGYGKKLCDLDFLPAALVFTRVVSKPGANRLCLDLGHKAIGSEMPPPRVLFLNLPDARAVLHSEEHLVVETERSAEFAVGDCLYGVPWHICPTVALHLEAVVLEEGKIVGRWKVAARERRLTI